MAMGAPKQYNVDDIVKAFDEYITANDEPLVQEFALNYGISRTHLYELSNSNSNLSDIINKCLVKQEIYLVRNASTNKINPVFTMFRLKQPSFGYKDKQEIESRNVNTTLDELKRLSDAELKAQIDAEVKKLVDDEISKRRLKVVND